jgi:hypothetical protein
VDYSEPEKTANGSQRERQGRLSLTMM